jgi:deoxycytidine triphosphate deaminase
MVQPGVLEPGWRGHPTIAIVVAADHIRLEPDDPIAQIIFHRIDARTNGYSGKYQDQGPLVQEAIFDDA